MIAYALWTYPKHPGRYGAIMLCSFGLTPILGSVGAPISLIGLGAAILKLAGRPQRISFPELAFCAWVVFLALSLFWSRDITASFTALAEVILLAGGAYLYGKVHISNEHFLSDVLDFTALTSLITVVALLSFAHGHGLRLGTTEDTSPVGVAGLPEVGLICCFSMLLFQPMLRWRRVFLLALLFGLFLPFALATGTRSVLLSFAVVTMMFGAYLLYDGRRGTVLKTLVSFVCLGVATYFAISWYIGPSGAKLTGNIVNRMVSLGGGVDPASLQRLDFYRQALGMFENSPLVGYGLAAFGYMADGLGATGVYPHNMFLEIMVDGGLIGLILFLLFLLPASVHGYRQLSRKRISWPVAVLIGLMTSALVRHQVSMSIFAGKELFFALGGIAGLIATYTSPVDRNRIHS